MKVSVQTILPMTASEVIARVQTPALLRHVAAPLVSFVPRDPTAFPDLWSEGQYRVWAWSFGFLPLGRQTIDISLDGPVDDPYAIRDNGHGDLARRWDHRIFVEPVDTQQTLYRDEIEIDAGLLTPLVWLFAQVFYRHRQRRWRQLARAEASPTAPLRRAVDDALTTARQSTDNASAWAALELAHVLSQSLFGPHLRVHRAMLRLAVATRNWREIAGQVARLVLTPIGHLTRRIPWGNSGRANVSPFLLGPLPDHVIKLYRTAGIEVKR